MLMVRLVQLEFPKQVAAPNMKDESLIINSIGAQSLKQLYFNSDISLMELLVHKPIEDLQISFF